MKKLFSYLIMLIVFTCTIVACGGNTDSSKNNANTSSSSVQPATKYTVQFYVEDTLYKTMKIEENTVIGASNVDNPIKENFTFVSWVDKDNNEINLDTYKVTGALKLYATFEEIITDDTLIVNGTKEEGKEYYLVVGW